VVVNIFLSYPLDLCRCSVAFGEAIQRDERNHGTESRHVTFLHWNISQFLLGLIELHQALAVNDYLIMKNNKKMLYFLITSVTQTQRNCLRRKLVTVNFAQSFYVLPVSNVRECCDGFKCDYH
jgi:hypothetical protein